MAVRDTHIVLLVRCCVAYVDIRNEQGKTRTDTDLQPYQ